MISSKTQLRYFLAKFSTESDADPLLLTVFYNSMLPEYKKFKGLLKNPTAWGVADRLEECDRAIELLGNWLNGTLIVSDHRVIGIIGSFGLQQIKELDDMNEE